MLTARKVAGGSSLSATRGRAAQPHLEHGGGAAHERDREAGASKLTMKQNVLYLRHLAHLYAFAYPKTLALALAALVALAAAVVRLALALLS